MSRLDELIAELCPDGVPYVALSTVAEYAKERIDAAEIDADTYVGVDNLLPEKKGKTVSSYVPNEGRLISFHVGDILIGNIRPYLKKIWLADSDGGTNGDVLPIHIRDKNVEPKFLYYCLSSDQFFMYDMQHAKGAKMPRGDKAAVMEYEVPVPPLEVQREIVRVLDNFTFLSAELSAELSARRKQYEYYRNQLLAFDTDVRRIPMGDLFDFKNGLSKGKEFFGRGTPFIRYTDVYNNRSLKRENIEALVECTPDELRKLKVSRGDVLFTRTSETAEDVGWSSVMLDELEDCVFNGFTIKATPKTDLLWPEYCAYCFATDDFRSYVTRHCAFTTRASLTGSTIAEYKLAVPSINVQKRIAAVLDNFEAICNDLGIGLPAEIDTRQKQYEYYRDLLLTFAETGSTLVTDGRTARQAEIALLQYVFGYAVVQLDEVIVSLNTGLNPRQFFKLNTDDAENYYITIREIVGGKIVPTDKTDRMNDEALLLCNNRSNLESGDVLFSGTGTIGETAVIEETPTNWNIKEGVYTIKPDQSMLHSHYLRYLLMTEKIKTAYMKKVAGGTVKSIPMREMKHLQIPLPAVEKQDELVEVISRFDKLCNDLSSGLPAEIEARQKQYEYYRDKLLTFKEKA